MRFRKALAAASFFLLAFSCSALLFLKDPPNSGGGILNPLLEWQRGFFGRGAVVFLSDQSGMQWKEKQKRLIAELGAIASKEEGEWGIAICDLERNDCFGINQDEVFEAASVMKVVTACYLINRVGKGELSLNQELQGKDLYEHLRLMINRSDNDSWYALSEFLGYGNIQKYGEGLGMNRLSTQTNSFSPNGVALVLRKLYRGEIADAQLTKLLFSFMRNTETENRIPAGVPEGVTVYHKSGTFGHLIHDAGIVEHPKNPYVLVVMGKNTDGALQASKTIAEISNQVYRFFDESDSL